MNRSDACILCNAPLDRSIREVEGYRICLNCDVTWCLVEGSSDPAEGWENNYYGRRDILRLHEVRRSGMDAIAARLSEICPNRGRLLDIGTGVGLFMKSAANNGWLVEGVEPSPTAAEKARELTGANVHQGLLENAQLSEHHYDAVSILDTLRSVPNPLPFLLRARSLLRPGGILLVREGYRKFRRYYMQLSGKANGLRVRGRRQPHEHAQSFSPRSLVYALHAVGLEGWVEPSPIFAELESGRGSRLGSFTKRTVGLGSSALYKISCQKIIVAPNLLAFGKAPAESSRSARDRSPRSFTSGQK
jgi:2-polyprenyl-3-methyl-5-hydroxy-6-metoxy-1,4-benzoquinol methylase